MMIGSSLDSVRFRAPRKLKLNSKLSKLMHNPAPISLKKKHKTAITRDLDLEMCNAFGKFPVFNFLVNQFGKIRLAHLPLPAESSQHFMT